MKSIPLKTFTFKHLTLVFRWKDLTVQAFLVIHGRKSHSFCVCNTEMMETYELINISSTKHQKKGIDEIVCRRYPSYPIQILRTMRETKTNSEMAKKKQQQQFISM